MNHLEATKIWKTPFMALQQEMLWVERFEGSGYVTWQLCLRIALIERDLWRIVDGLEEKREATIFMVDHRENQHTILENLVTHSCVIQHST